MLLQLVEPGQTPNPHATSPGVVVGIDLGTTHTVAAVVQNGKPCVLHLHENGPLIPSVLSVTKDELRVAVSSEQLSSTKRLMGRDVVRLKIGSHHLTPVEVASHILSHVRQGIEKTLEVPLEGAVITVPAYFDEAARVATKQAAAHAGIKVLRLINEPTAAALAYGLETGAEGIYAIYDFGGGTFDLSLLKLEGGVFQVLATGGDLNLGGDDIDHLLAQKMQISDLNKARALKERLSDQELCDGITRADLEKIAAPFIAKTLSITHDVFKEAELIPQEIQGVVLVGGMTRIPLVRREVETFFGKVPLCKIDPDQAVALGAAISAHGLKYGSEMLLLDVTPLSLGIETMGGLVEKIIPRNTALPTIASQEFTTSHDGQGGIIIHVVQGEREFVQDCRSLARFELKGLPAVPAGTPRVRIDFMVDVEGLLTVSAFEKTTGLSQHVEVHPSYGLDENTLSEMILESQKHGKEDMQKRLEAEKALNKERDSLFK